MPTYLIKKTIETYLTVQCDNEEQARVWGARIVPRLEDEHGDPIPPDAIDNFGASTNSDEIEIELLHDDEE